MTMTRDDDAIKITQKWAETGDRIDPDNMMLNPVLSRATGWPSTFSDPQGDTPRRQVFNQLLAEVTAALLEINQHGGILTWDSRVSYVHTAHVLGSDNRIYRSKVNSLNQDPVTDVSRTYWEPLINTVSGLIAPTAASPASETVAGVSEWANQTEMDAGDAMRVARPNVIVNWIANSAMFAASRVMGILGVANIPDLGAQKIISGQFHVDRIPGLPASKTTDGRFVEERIPISVLNAAVQTGSILDFGGTVAPSGYLICDGQAVSRTTYDDLFGVIGETWGQGDGSTTFNLPDLRRRTTIGQGGIQRSGPGIVVGNVGGEEQHTLVESEIPVHQHSYTASSGSRVVDILGQQTAQAATAPSARTTGNTGGDGAHNNMPPSAVVNKIIKT